MKTIHFSLLCGSLLLAGCVGSDSNPRARPVVPGNPFNKPVSAIDPATLKPTPHTESAARVDFLGREFLAANPQLGLAPKFCTIDQPNPEIFHLDSKAIYITEGLVQRCRPQTKDDLAAILANELGKMSAERQTTAAVYGARDFDRPPIMTDNIGNDHQVDMTNQAQFLKYENTRQLRNQARPNSRFQAQVILEKAGYSRTALDAVTPLLDEADRGAALERQAKGTPQKSEWNK